MLAGVVMFSVIGVAEVKYRVTCPGCKKSTTVSDELLGRRVKCSGCGIAFTVPSQSNNLLSSELKNRSDTLAKQESFVFDQPLTQVGRGASDVTIEHRHKATGGAFRMGFGIMLGCLTAGALFTVGGCVVLAIISAGISSAAKDAAENRKAPDSTKSRNDVKEAASNFQQQINSTLAAPSPDPSSFSYQNVTMRSSYGMVRFVGEVTNNSDISYKIANFTVTLYEKNGRLIDTGPAIVSNLARGETKSFEAMFVGDGASKTANYKIQFENGF